jgi:hypothetical protein
MLLHQNFYAYYKFSGSKVQPGISFLHTFFKFCDQIVYILKLSPSILDQSILGTNQVQTLILHENGEGLEKKQMLICSRTMRIVTSANPIDEQEILRVKNKHEITLKAFSNHPII